MFKPLNGRQIMAGLASAVALTLAAPALADTAKPATEPTLIEQAQARSAAEAQVAEIVGGSTVLNTVYNLRFRWMVSLQTTAGAHFCGGSLIGAQWVLTAAHCLEGGVPEQLQVMHGSRQLSAPGTRVTVDAIITSPEYNTATTDSDVALLRLSRPLPAPYAVQATRAFTNAWARPGRQMTILGWGALRSGGSSPDLMQWARVPIATEVACRRAYGASTITTRMICAGYPAGGIDTCQGDSGGPLATQDPLGNWRIVGITSFGNGCALPNTPGVYARVGEFQPFLNLVRQGRGEACTEATWPVQMRRPTVFGCSTLTNNDDGSTRAVSLGFTVRMGSRTFDTVYINNNGNLTFGVRNAAPSFGSLSEATMPIIAPFFDDVNTSVRGSVRYGRTMIGTSRAFVVFWDDAPGYSAPTLQNTFQVVLVDRGNGNFAIEFNYGEIRWHTNALAGFQLVPGGSPVVLAGADFRDTAATGLIRRSNVRMPGRFRWEIRGGAVQ